MGIHSASATFTRFYVPEIVTEDFWSFVEEKLMAGIFKELEETNEQSVGFASWEDMFEPRFDYGSYHKGEYVAFTFRQDQRKVPAIIVKKYIREAVQKYRDENEGKWPPRHERQEIQENISSWLLSRAFPQPSACEIVWSPAGKWMLLGTTSAKMMEAYLEHFEKHFNIYPVPLYHVHWALNLIPLDERQKDALNAIVSAKSPQALDDGRYLGYEFLTWLWFFSESMDGTIQISEEKEAKVHLGERMVLTLPGEGKEKVVCTTQANSLHEARTALQQGKLVHEMQIFLMIGDNEYLFTLDSGLWAVKGLKTPKQLQNLDEEDPDGMFLEKMYFIEEVSLALNTLYAKFLNERLSSTWELDVLPVLKQWVQGEAAPIQQIQTRGSAPF
jgi:DNA recombination-dependent growth factor C